MKPIEFNSSRIEVVEIFKSISGEGISAGEVVAFLRVAGCNLRCSYCDTQYSHLEDNPKNRLLYPKEILSSLKDLEVNKVICTGGEPLEVGKAKRYLPIYLASEGFEVRIESNGSYPIYNKEELFSFASDKEFKLNYTLDIKTPSSGMEGNNIFDENLSKLSLGDELKLVVGDEGDLDYSIAFLKEYSKSLASNNVIVNFSPIFGMMKAERLVDFLLEWDSLFSNMGLELRLSLQIHKFIWPSDKRGV